MPSKGAAVHPDQPGDRALHEAANFIFVADLDTLDAEPPDAHHLVHVLRLRPGELVAAGDGRGRWRATRYRGTGVGARSGDALLEPDGPVVECPKPSPAITIGFVPVKGDRPEWTVQKLTEAGVDRIALLRSARAVVRWEGARRDRAIERLRRVAREAAAQSRRPWLPDLDGVMTLDDLAGTVSPGPLALAHPGGDPPTPRLPAVAVGPEGGWDPAETSRGHPLVGLGPGVFRSETAAIAAGLLLCALRDRIVAPANSAAER